MLVVDSQIHPWSNGTSTGHHRRDPIDAHRLQQEMTQAGVDRAVLVPPLWDPDGNDYSLRLAAQHPDRFCVMGLLNPALPDASEQLQGWLQQPGMRGVRFLLNTPARTQPLDDGTLDALWPIAEAHGIAVSLLMPGRLLDVAPIARRHPRLKLLVDHLGVPRGAVGEMAFKHLPDLLALAAFPNVQVKAAGVGDYALDPFPFKSLLDPLQRIFNAFGAGRVIWGSDLSRLHHPYSQCVDHFKSQLPFLSSTEVEKVMGENIISLLDWKSC